MALLALTAPLGLHRPLLLYPARAIYSLLALVLLLFSFGRIRIETPVRGAFRRGKKRQRSWKSALRDWRREQEEERVVWSSGEDGKDSLPFVGDDSQ